MRIPAAVTALLLLAARASAQDNEDEAHKADRLRTQALNQRSPNGYLATPHADQNDQGHYDYAQAQAEYRHELAEWRRRVAACEAGYYDACQR
jgi:Flp pilus assembly protein TadG